MARILEPAALQKMFAELPLETFEAGETVLEAGTATGRLLILKEGVVEVVKDDVRIGEVSDPGAVFGELAALLDQPHTADVRAIEPSRFHVAEAATLLTSDPTVALYIATIMAYRLDRGNQALVEVRKELEAGRPRSAIARALDKLGTALRHNNDPDVLPFYYHGGWY